MPIKTSARADHLADPLADVLADLRRRHRRRRHSPVPHRHRYRPTVVPPLRDWLAWAEERARLQDTRPTWCRGPPQVYRLRQRMELARLRGCLCPAISRTSCSGSGGTRYLTSSAVVCVRFAVLRPPRYMFRHTPLSQQAGAGGAFDMPVQWRRGESLSLAQFSIIQYFSTTWAPGESSDLCTCTMHVPFPSLRSRLARVGEGHGGKVRLCGKGRCCLLCAQRIPSAWKGRVEGGFCACRCGPRTGRRR